MMDSGAYRGAYERTPRTPLRAAYAYVRSLVRPHGKARPYEAYKRTKRTRTYAECFKVLCDGPPLGG